MISLPFSILSNIARVAIITLVAAAPGRNLPSFVIPPPRCGPGAPSVALRSAADPGRRGAWGKPTAPAGAPIPGSPSLDAADSEILMSLSICVTGSPDGGDTEVLAETVRLYLESYPFAVLLPVQPMRCLPSHMSKQDYRGAGIEIAFLRKPSAEKGSVDGGIFFDVYQSGGKVCVVAARNAEGQAIPKTFSERAIVLGIVGGIESMTKDWCTEVSGIFHLWQ